METLANTVPVLVFAQRLSRYKLDGTFDKEVQVESGRGRFLFLTDQVMVESQPTPEGNIVPAFPERTVHAYRVRQEPELTPKQRKALESAVWSNTHRDYKSGTGETRTMLHYSDATGTCSMQVKHFTNLQLLDKLRPEQKEAFSTYYMR